MKLVKGGVFVGARILHEPPRDPETGEPLDRSWLWHGLINGESDPHPSPAPSLRVLRIWTSGSEIDEAEYRYLLDLASWARDNAPSDGYAEPAKKVDLRAMNPILPPRRGG